MGEFNIVLKVNPNKNKLEHFSLQRPHDSNPTEGLMMHDSDLKPKKRCGQVLEITVESLYIPT